MAHSTISTDPNRLTLLTPQPIQSPLQIENTIFPLFQNISFVEARKYCKASLRELLQQPLKGKKPTEQEELIQGILQAFIETTPETKNNHRFYFSILDKIAERKYHGAFGQMVQSGFLRSSSNRELDYASLRQFAAETASEDLFDFIKQNAPEQLFEKSSSQVNILHLSAKSGASKLFDRMRELSPERFNEFLKDTDLSQSNVLYYAVEGKHLSIFKWLAEHDRSTFIQLLTSPCNQFASILHAAAFSGFEELFEWLEDNFLEQFNEMLQRADKNDDNLVYKLARSGSTHLIIHLQANYPIIIEPLLCMGFNHGNLLHIAAKKRLLNLFQWLKAKFPAIFKEFLAGTDLLQNTVLHFLITSGAVEILRWLHQNEAQAFQSLISQSDYRGWSPITAAAVDSQQKEELLLFLKEAALESFAKDAKSIFSSLFSNKERAIAERIVDPVVGELTEEELTFQIELIANLLEEDAIDAVIEKMYLLSPKDYSEVMLVLLYRTHISQYLFQYFFNEVQETIDFSELESHYLLPYLLPSEIRQIIHSLSEEILSIPFYFPKLIGKTKASIWDAMLYCQSTWIAQIDWDNDPHHSLILAENVSKLLRKIPLHCLGFAARFEEVQKKLLPVLRGLTFLQRMVILPQFSCEDMKKILFSLSREELLAFIPDLTLEQKKYFLTHLGEGERLALLFGQRVRDYEMDWIVSLSKAFMSGEISYDLPSLVSTILLFPAKFS